MDIDDKPLVAAFQDGDEFAFISLYNRYKQPVYAFCVKMLRDREQAQDVLQETFLRVYENRERLVNAGAFKSWLFTIARNQCLNHLRQQSRQVSLEREANEEPTIAEKEQPGAHLEKSERIALVNEYLETLSPEYREVLVLREYQNLSYEEIAAVTRNTISSVKSRLFKARRKLGHMLAPLLEATPSR